MKIFWLPKFLFLYHLGRVHVQVKAIFLTSNLSRTCEWVTLRAHRGLLLCQENSTPWLHLDRCSKSQIANRRLGIRNSHESSNCTPTFAGEVATDDPPVINAYPQIFRRSCMAEPAQKKCDEDFNHLNDVQTLKSHTKLKTPNVRLITSYRSTER